MFSQKRLQLLDDQIAEAIEAQLLTGTWPKNRPVPILRSEGEGWKASVHYDRQNSEWVLLYWLAGDNTPTRHSAPRLGELQSRFLQARAELTEETLAHNAEVEAEESDPDFLEAERWKNQFRTGAEYVALQPFLTEKERHEMFISLRNSLNSRGIGFTAENLCTAYDELLDADGRFAELWDKAQAAKAEHEAAELAEKEAAEVQAAQQIPVEAETPSSNLVNRDDNRRTVEHDLRSLASTKSGMELLKRKAIAERVANRRTAEQRTPRI